MHPKDLSISDYSYDLPEEKIAKYPLTERDASRLLIYENGKIREDIYRNLDEHLPQGSLLVFNDTRVIEARLLFQKPTGGMIEIFCLEPHDQYGDITTAMLRQDRVLWQCLIGGASKWKPGQVLEKKYKKEEMNLVLKARYLEKRSDSFMIEFSWTPPSLSFAEVLHLAGDIPLPPYLKRKVEASDAQRYQTIYAHYEGSVAAPTAGLHFTETILEKLKAKNIPTDFVTLHVGAGTFKPVKTATLERHEMHAEFLNVSKKTIENILQHLPGNIIAVGTTSLRTIESLYWLGVKWSPDTYREVSRPSAVESLPQAQQSSVNNDQIHRGLAQWEPYELKDDMDPKEALQSLLDFMNKRQMQSLITKTQIIIAPPYKLKIAKGLVTNFHQPQSTLLLLIAALVGKDWKDIYDYALRNEFRFLSYGDGCLLLLD